MVKPRRTSLQSPNYARRTVSGLRAPHFSNRFAAEVAAFARTICGLSGAARQGHASRLVHRLMFVNFLQENGLLPGDRSHFARLLHTSANGAAASFYHRGLLPFFRTGPLRFVFPADPRESGIDIPDTAFRRLFDFFDSHSWHLGDGPPRNPDAITPEMLGVHFERHVNRRQMGSYYTPADVTAYIAGAAILPFVLDEVRRRCPAGFAKDGVWALLRAGPDRYIPEALRATAALPTETAEEHAARRRRCRALRSRLRSGRVVAVNDLVTLNLDLRRFVLDVIDTEPELRPACAEALGAITVLDPTCGSGAFLLAALQVLEEVGVVCTGRSAFDVRRSILERNLHGIDLMDDAVELCKLRLLLKLLAAAKGRVDLGNLLDLRTIYVGDVLAEPGPKDRAWEAGFHIIIGNPPYLPAKNGRRAPGDFSTARCPDVYAWVLERSARLLRPGGRCGMIVPLSLGFSDDFAACRRLLFNSYDTNWFASFARIPAALFAGDVRVRNTIHLGHKGDAPGRQYTTRLYRWFEEARPHLFPTLHYAPFTPERWRGRVPKIDSPALMEALEKRLVRQPARLGDGLSPKPTRHVLHVKKTAYNWLTFCRRLPPCYDADGRPVAHTQFDTLFFPDAATRDLALLFLNGKWCYLFWSAVGDDFHVARWTFADFPIDLARLPASAIRRLRPLARELERAMQRVVVFKRNAGRRVGSYNLARCRHVTDRSDRIFAKCLGLADVWNDVELHYRQIVKTEFATSPLDRPL